MRIIIIVLLSFISFTGYGQTIVKGAGILYTSGVPSHDPGAKGSEVAIDTLTNSWYQWTGAAWVERGFTDNQVISIDSVAGSSVKYYTATLSNGGTISWRDSFPSGGVTGSGTTNELPYWATSSSLGSLTTATYPSLTELSYVKGVTSAIQTQFNAKHGGSLTSGYVPYSGGGYGLLNSNIYYNGTNVGIGTTTPAPNAAWNPGRCLNIVDKTNNLPNLRFQSSATDFTFAADNANVFFYLATNSGMRFYTNATEKLRLYPSGGLSFGNSFVSTDPGAGKMIVSGNVGIGQNTPTARLHVTGSGSTSSTTALLVENSSGTDALTVRDDQLVIVHSKAAIGGASGPTWSSGTGTPEGVVTANIGSIFSRTDGGAGTSFYVKESGTGNTGWVAK